MLKSYIPEFISEIYAIGKACASGKFLITIFRFLNKILHVCDCTILIESI